MVYTAPRRGINGEILPGQSDFSAPLSDPTLNLAQPTQTHKPTELQPHDAHRILASLLAAVGRAHHYSGHSTARSSSSTLAGFRWSA
jgi:hypothetical protein